MEITCARVSFYFFFRPKACDFIKKETLAYVEFTRRNDNAMIWFCCMAISKGCETATCCYLCYFKLENLMLTKIIEQVLGGLKYKNEVFQIRKHIILNSSILKSYTCCWFVILNIFKKIC